MQTGSVISLSTSFSGCSNSRLAGIAARVVEEFGSDEYYDEFCFEREQDNSGLAERETGDGSVKSGDGDGEFEFDVVKRESELPSPVSADDIFCNGQIRPVYPVLDQDLFLNKRNNFEEGGEKGNDDGVDPTVRLPLRKLFIEERETTMTNAAKDLKGVSAEIYCVWRPKQEEENERSRKINSAWWNSKRWKFKDLLHRSASDGGKDRFVFLSHSCSGRRKENDEIVKTPSTVAAGKPPPYNRAGKSRSSIYRTNGLSRNLYPFLN